MIGEIIQGRYRPYKILGTKGFYETYLATNLLDSQNSPCVVKQIMLISNQPDILAEARKRFEIESSTLKKLGYHPQIPSLIDYFEQNNDFYLIYEFIKGKTLREEFVAEKIFNEQPLIYLLREILDTLNFVHSHKIIHRDVNPEHLIRREQDGKLVLINFGYVKQRLGLDPQTLKSMINIGTPGYMPKEQLEGNPKLCSDVYAVGTIGIEALTGVSPNQWEKDPQTDEIVWRDRAEVSPAFADILDNMVRSYFRDRYQSAAEAIAAIDALLPKIIAVKPPPKQKQNLAAVPPRKLDRYQIMRTLGSGSFGQTYLVKDKSLHDKPMRVLKQLKPKNTDPSTLVAARDIFDREAKILLQIGEKGRIPKLVDYFEIEAEFYLIQEFITGDSLSEEPADSLSEELSTGTHWSPARVFDLMLEILEALDTLHQENVIHGNISLRNVIRRESDQKLVLIDLGGVKEIVNVDPNSERNSLLGIGTPGYIPPEQAEGNPKRSSDIYAVGIIGIQALTGLSSKIIQKQIDRESGKILWRDVWLKKNKGIIPELADILDKMVCFESAKRYKSAKEAHKELRDLLGLKDWLGEGNLRFANKQFDRAITCYDEILVKMPDFYRAFHQKGEVFFKWKKYKEALECFVKAVNLNPNYYKPLVRIGDILRKSKQYQEAIEYYEKALKLEPNCVEALYGKGVILAKLGEYKKAIELYAEIIEIDDKYYKALCRWADALLELNCLSEALDIYEQVIQNKPKYVEAWYGQAKALEQISEYEEALRYYQKVSQLKDTYAEAWYGQGKMLEALLRYNEAMKAYQKAIALDPDFAEAMEKLKNVESQQMPKWLRCWKISSDLIKNLLGGARR